MPTSTVLEAITFSAELRLGAAVDAATRRDFVQGIVEVLELGSVGAQRVSTLGRGELKRLTVGVELAANSPILFCDEPTTGLDSRSAAVVMRVLRKIASTGRTVVCTIHQPSSDVFFEFDRCLLLAPGGKTVFFGP